MTPEQLKQLIRYDIVRMYELNGDYSLWVVDEVRENSAIIAKKSLIDKDNCKYFEKEL